MEFLYIPLAIIAAFGVTRIAELAPLSKVFPLILAAFVIVSVVTSFPSVVFWGTAFEPGHPLFDTRSLVIQHQASEISAISWLNNTHAAGVIETDSYVGYAAGGMINMPGLAVQSEYPFVKPSGYPQSTSKNRATALSSHSLTIYGIPGIWCTMAGRKTSARSGESYKN